METFVFFIVGLACVLSVVVLWLLVTLVSLRKKNLSLHQHLTVAESELIRVKESLHHFEKKLAKNQEQQTGGVHQNEIFDLRRDNARLKDELKKHKEDLRIKDIEMKKLEALHIDKLFLITKEKDTLLAQLKELDASYAEKTTSLDHTIEDLKQQRSELAEKAIGFEKQTKSNISKLITLQSKLNVAEQEISKLTKEIKSQGNTVDASLLDRWKDRAQCARRMYQLMRQMRELSDNKVQSYQEGIIATCEWILKQTNMPIPNIAENENKADRLLAEAWTAVISTNYVEHAHTQIDPVLETRV